MVIGKKSDLLHESTLFEDEIDYIQAYQDILTEGLDVSLDFVSEMCEAFVMFDKVEYLYHRTHLHIPSYAFN